MGRAVDPLRRRAALALLVGPLLVESAAARTWDAGLLSADAAFRLIPARRDGDTIIVTWLIASGYYLYRDRLHFRATQPAGVRLLEPLLPQALQQAEPQQGRKAVYRIALRALLRWGPGTAPSRLEVGYQGCADAGFCYPPQTRLLNVSPGA